MNVAVSTCPPGAAMLTADCAVCGAVFRALTDATPRVDHRCPTAAVGPVWVLTDTGSTLRRQPAPSYEASR